MDRLADEGFGQILEHEAGAHYAARQAVEASIMEAGGQREDKGVVSVAALSLEQIVAQVGCGQGGQDVVVVEDLAGNGPIPVAGSVVVASCWNSKVPMSTRLPYRRGLPARSVGGVL